MWSTVFWQQYWDRGYHGAKDEGRLLAKLHLLAVCFSLEFQQGL